MDGKTENNTTLNNNDAGVNIALIEMIFHTNGGIVCIILERPQRQKKKIRMSQCKPKLAIPSREL